AGVLVNRVLKIAPSLIVESRVSLQVVACAVPAFLVIGSMRGVLEAAQRFDLVNLIRAPFLASYFLVPLVGVWLGFDLVGIVELLVVISGITLVAYAAACIRVFPAINGRPSIEMAQFLR